MERSESEAKESADWEEMIDEGGLCMRGSVLDQGRGRWRKFLGESGDQDMWWSIVAVDLKVGHVIVSWGFHGDDERMGWKRSKTEKSIGVGVKFGNFTFGFEIRVKLQKIWF